MNTEKILDMSKVLQQKRSFDGIKETITQQRNEILENMTEKFDIDEALNRFTEEEILNMSFEEMRETFVNKEGQFIFNEEEFPKQMIMDFIIYLKQSKVAYDKMDEEMDKMDKYLEEFNEEIKEITEQKGSFNKTLREAVEADLAKEDCSDELKNRCHKILSAMDDAVTLRPLFELYEKISPVNTLKELKLESKRIEVLKAYTRVCKENGFEPKLLAFGKLENAILDEKYHEHENLFIFIVARYIKYLDRKVNDMENRTFIVQLTNFLREFVLGEESAHYQADKEELEALKVNIQNLLDKFYN